MDILIALLCVILGFTAVYLVLESANRIAERITFPSLVAVCFIPGFATAYLLWHIVLSRILITIPSNKQTLLMIITGILFSAAYVAGSARYYLVKGVPPLASRRKRQW